MSEKSIKAWFKLILKGVRHIHQNNIIHRDLKLENIIVKIKNENLDDMEIEEIRIVDFGCGITSDKKIKGFMGTPQYMPPEALKKSPYNDKFDMWSLGIILYFACTLTFPFGGDNINDLFQNIKICSINLHNKKFENYSNELIDFLSLLLDKQPETRISSADALNHPWFDSLTSNEFVPFTPRTKRKSDTSLNA